MNTGEGKSSEKELEKERLADNVIVSLLSVDFESEASDVP